MPYGDPAGYLPRVKQKRKKKRGGLVEVKSKLKRPYKPIKAAKRVAAKTGGTLAPAKLGTAPRGAAQRRAIQKQLDELRKRQRGA